MTTLEQILDLGPDIAVAFENLTFSEYLDIDAVNSSCLKHGRDRTPSHISECMIRSRFDTSSNSPSLRIGALVHSMCLEPETVDELYVVKPGNIDRRTREGKAQYEQWSEKAGDRQVILGSEWNLATSMAESFRNSFAAPYIEKESVPASQQYESWFHGREMTIVWVDPEGTVCKARLDACAWNDVEFRIFDIKTTDNASPDSFKQTASRYGYDMQAAFYSWAAHEFSGVEPENITVQFIVIEKQSPHNVACYTLAKEDIETAGVEIQKMLKEFSEDPMRGYPEHAVELSRLTNPSERFG